MFKTKWWPIFLKSIKSLEAHLLENPFYFQIPYFHIFKMVIINQNLLNPLLTDRAVSYFNHLSRLIRKRSSRLGMRYKGWIMRWFWVEIVLIRLDYWLKSLFDLINLIQKILKMNSKISKKWWLGSGFFKLGPSPARIIYLK